jgi:hypothetical protein
MEQRNYCIPRHKAKSGLGIFPFFECCFPVAQVVLPMNRKTFLHEKKTVLSFCKHKNKP